MAEKEPTEISEKCSAWLNSCEIASCSSECSEFSSSTDLTSEHTSNSAMESGFSFITNAVTTGEIIVQNTGDHTRNYHMVTSLKKDNGLRHGNIQVYKSKKVHIGDVNYLNGPIYMKDTTALSLPLGVNEVKPLDIKTAPLNVIPRRNWLAQPSLEVEYLEKPAKHVIICHSATEESMSIADNVLLVRLIQNFHIESRKWSDIGYNFLIGSDGSIFEGRGWNVMGSHTYSYNSTSVGISFIGTFTHKTPPAKALERAKVLIAHGVAIGAIDKDYILLGHCQCSGTESPGSSLFNEIKTWNNFNPDISVNNLSPAHPSLNNVNKTSLP